MGKVKELMYGDQIINVAQLKLIMSDLDDHDQLTLVTCDEHGDEQDHYPMAIDVIEGIRLIDDTIVREVQFVQRPNSEPDTRDKQPVVNALIDVLAEDIAKGDTTVLDELLLRIPYDVLKYCLPEDMWADFNIPTDAGIQEFKAEWGQEELDICAELRYEVGDDGTSELLMSDGYFWNDDASLWYPESSSMYSKRQQEIADHLRYI